MQDVPADGDVRDEKDSLTNNFGGAEEAADGPLQVAHSLFPSPPTVFTRFTRQNVARYQVLKKAKEEDEKTMGGFDWTNADPGDRIARQREILERAAAEEETALADTMPHESADANAEDDESGNGKQRASGHPHSLLPAPEWDILLAMEPARIEWIEEEGHYTCFGEQWPVNETLPPLEAMGMTQIYPQQAEGNAINRPEILTTLLRTMLKSYLGLVDVLLNAPKEYLANEHDPATGQLVSQQWRFTSQDKAREINDLSINFMHLLNESRPLQAREQLRDMMRDQLDRRREEAALIKSQCSAMRREIASIREKMQKEAGDVAETM